MEVVGLNHSQIILTDTLICVWARRGGVVPMCRHGGAASRNVDGAGGQTCSKSSIPIHVCCPAGPDKKGEAGSGTISPSTTCISPKGWLIFFSLFLFVCSSPFWIQISTPPASGSGHAGAWETNMEGNTVQPWP
jgi:hypothetical protein